MSTQVARRPAGSVYGRIITGHDVEQAALDTLREHMGRYLRETERQAGRELGRLPEPRGYIVASRFERWPEDQTPVCVVISPGLAGNPTRHGTGQTTARWQLAAGIITSAASQDRARENGMVYVAAIRALLAQHESLGGLATGVEWIDEGYDVAPFNVRRSLWGAQAICAVTVENAVTFGAGAGAPDTGWPPDARPPTNPPNFPTVREATVTLTLEPIGGAHE